MREKLDNRLCSSNIFAVILLLLLTRGSHSHRACRTICDWDQNEIKGSTCNFVLNQAIKECFKEAIKRLVKEEG